MKGPSGWVALLRFGETKLMASEAVVSGAPALRAGKLEISIRKI
ncbi:hypothetical protein RGAI101_3374 [Roseobacter sp. GAI101]|nr:hypothetical protein RGAI101_3374 [Roseobacter sp. GAI101]